MPRPGAPLSLEELDEFSAGGVAAEYLDVGFGSAVMLGQ